jgi:hypothetical protein
MPVHCMPIQQTQGTRSIYDAFYYCRKPCISLITWCFRLRSSSRNRHSFASTKRIDTNTSILLPLQATCLFQSIFRDGVNQTVLAFIARYLAYCIFLFCMRVRFVCHGNSERQSKDESNECTIYNQE